ncbi:hypothetical protein TCE0_060f18944 [Talaromyces pinophilus]|uniref:Plastocyanin-like domain-containing protein n=1 Tax=Talaromyces pinophilus TaxID=128442 RepID=A0A6V8HPE0_TALPI|nr:hypothetical protein TCE0_060f18944 [Talaromyces pinophilus]
MRLNISAFGSLVPVPPQPFALAAVHYEDACTDSLPITVASSSSENNCGVTPIEEIYANLSLTPPAFPSATQVVNMSLYTNSTGYCLFHMNDVSFRVNYDHPVLLLAHLGNVSYPNDPQWNVYNFGSSDSPSYSIRIIFLNTTPLVLRMHLHDHQYWLEAVGTGQWNGTVTNHTVVDQIDSGL